MNVAPRAGRARRSSGPASRPPGSPPDPGEQRALARTPRACSTSGPGGSNADGRVASTPSAAPGSPSRAQGAAGEHGDGRRDGEQVLEALDRPQLEEGDGHGDPAQEQRSLHDACRRSSQRPITAASNTSGPITSRDRLRVEEPSRGWGAERAARSGSSRPVACPPGQHQAEGNGAITSDHDPQPQPARSRRRTASSGVRARNA